MRFTRGVEMRLVVCLILGMTLAWLVTFPAMALSEISEQGAIERANQAVAKFGVQAPDWTARVDKAGEVWARTRSKWEDTRNPAVRKEAAQDIADIESTWRGKKIWTIIYTRTVQPGQKMFDTQAMVFVDANTGAVLSVINQEGGIETYEKWGRVK
jgi:predicted small secreted protein